MNALLAVVTRLLAWPINWAPAIAPPRDQFEFRLAAGFTSDATPSAT